MNKKEKETERPKKKESERWGKKAKDGEISEVQQGHCVHGRVAH